MIEFKMPDIGEGVTEGEVVKWHVKEGETVGEDQPLVEVMTDKATVVIPSPTRAVVRSILVGEGQTVKVGAPLVSFGGEGEAPGAQAAPASATGAAATTPAPAAPGPAPRPAAMSAAPAAPGPAPRPAAMSAAPAAPGPAPRATASAPSVPVPPRAARAAERAEPRLPADPGNGRPAPAQETAAPSATARVLAAPATRKAAREAGVDLGRIQGTGPGGRITREDLEGFIQWMRQGGAEAEPDEQARGRVAEPETWPGETAPEPERAGMQGTRPAPAPVTFAAGPRPETRVPMRGIRRRIAENMRRSKDHAAHFTYVEECDMTELTRLRQAVEPMAKERGVRLTYLPFIVKAVVAGLRAFPYLNASYDEESQEIVLKGYYHLGIAVSSDDGLMVPVLHDCDRLSVMELAAEIHRLGEGARQGTLTRDDLTGSTFTITSLGRLGGILATPVINYPEVAILGVHRIRRRPVVRDEQVVIRDVGYLSISIDHRIVDGQAGAEFMEHVVRLLEDPRMLLLG